MEPTITLKPLLLHERAHFIKRNQEAFMKAVRERYGVQQTEVISEDDILQSLEQPHAQSFDIVCDAQTVGGVIVQVNPTTKRNALDILFVTPHCHSQGIGTRVWALIEQRYPDTIVWETHTPYFETRNIHFYVNKCGFHIVEFFNPQHPDPHPVNTPGGDLFFRFEKKMR